MQHQCTLRCSARSPNTTHCRTVGSRIYNRARDVLIIIRCPFVCVCGSFFQCPFRSSSRMSGTFAVMSAVLVLACFGRKIIRLALAAELQSAARSHGSTTRRSRIIVVTGGDIGGVCVPCCNRRCLVNIINMQTTRARADVLCASAGQLLAYLCDNPQRRGWTRWICWVLHAMTANWSWVCAHRRC